MSKQKELKEGVGKSLKTGLTAVTKNFALPAVDALVFANPQWSPAWFLVRGYLSVAFDLQQDKINEFVEFIKEHPATFAREIVESKEFQEGFLISLEAYLKQRSQKKRKIIQRIFLGFTGSKDKENFELERMYWIVSILTVDEILLLNSYRKRPEIYKYNNFSEEKRMLDEKREIEEEKDTFRRLANFGLMEVVNYPGTVIGASKNYLEIKGLSALGKLFVRYIDETS